jgi:hypothetical protein
VTTATSGTRQIIIDVDDGTNLIFRVVAGAGQIASRTQRYIAGPALPHQTAFVPNADQGGIFMPLPANLVLPAGYRIRVYDSAAVDAAADDLTVRVLREAREV